MRNNTYWNGKGELQNEYNEMLEAVDEGTFNFTKASDNEFYRYCRYYNDGDLPGWARGHYDLAIYDWQRRSTKLTEKGEEELEARVTKKLAAEWKRYMKVKKTA